MCLKVIISLKIPQKSIFLHVILSFYFITNFLMTIWLDPYFTNDSTTFIWWNLVTDNAYTQHWLIICVNIIYSLLKVKSDYLRNIQTENVLLNLNIQIKRIHHILLAVKSVKILSKRNDDFEVTDILFSLVV